MSEEQGKTGIATTEEKNLPPEMEEVVDSVPEEKREQFRQLLSFSMSMMTRTSPQAEMLRRITPENFDHILTNEAEETKLAFKDKSESRKTVLVIVIAILVFLVLAMLVLRDNPQLLKEIIIALLAFAGGAVGGFGYGSKKKSDDD